jgi:hypothetical protein
MRKIKIKKWSANVPIRNANGEVTGSKQIDEDLLIALNVLVGMKDQQTMPKGIDKFRIFTKIAESFDKAVKAGVLELEDREYTFLKETIEREIPSSWGLNKDLSVAIMEFLEAKDA